MSAAGIGAAGASLGERTVLAQATRAKVPRRILGTTGVDVPILLMGGEVAFDPKFDKLLHRAFKDGVNYIDTAEEYSNGKSQVGVGVFQEQVGRENVWITTKAGLWSNMDASQPERYAKALEESLHPLKTDTVDMFLMHGVENPQLLDKPWIDMGQKMKKEGKTKFFGFSCHDGTVVKLMNKAAGIGSAGIDAVMFKYSFAEYGNIELNKAMDACVKAGIGLIAMKAQDSVPQDQEEVKNFQSNNFTLPQAKLKAVWADERISACVSGITNTSILKENATAAKSLAQLSMNEWTQLNQYAARTADHRCALCSEVCESQIDGELKVAKALRYLMYEESYDQHEIARRLYDKLTPGERDFDSPDLTRAMAACPRGIDIAARLKEAKRRLA